MSVFENLTNEGLEESEDRLGGYNIRDTDIYLGKIKAAYAGKSDGGAQYIGLVITLPDGEYNETIYITNKKGENFFLNKDDNSKKVPLPGFTLIDDLCLVTTGKPLSKQVTEEKTVKLYDYEERKELPKNVPMLMDLIDTEAYFAIVKQTVDKTKKNDSTGEYDPTGETRDENVIEKVFHNPSRVTVVEQREAVKHDKTAEPVFFDKWVEKNKGNTRNKSKSGNVGNAPKGGQQAPKKTTSLFGN